MKDRMWGGGFGDPVGLLSWGGAPMGQKWSRATVAASALGSGGCGDISQGTSCGTWVAKGLGSRLPLSSPRRAQGFLVSDVWFPPVLEDLG